MKQLILLAILLCGCSDAALSKIGSLGSEHKIILYSGGKKVVEWTSTGAISNEESSDGYYFRDKSSERLIRISGDIVIERIE